MLTLYFYDSHAFNSKNIDSRFAIECAILSSHILTLIFDLPDLDHV